MRVRDFDVDDAEWAATLMERRREVYSSYSPVFWRPASGVTERHAGFLRRLAGNPANRCLRAEHGFVIGQLHHHECVMDDFAVDDMGTWADDGRALLDALWARIADDAIVSLRVVTAKADRDKVAMLNAAGLVLSEEWWVKPIHSAGGSDPASGRVAGAGFSGLLGPAPPVYDPGGPVLLVDRLDHDGDLAGIEEQAAGMGAVLVIVALNAGDDRNHELTQRDWAVASQWYVGRPQPSK